MRTSPRHFQKGVVGAIIGALLITGVMVRPGFTATCPADAYVSLPSDPWIPDVAHPCFAQGRSIVQSVSNGSWSSSATWDRKGGKQARFSGIESSN